MHQKKSDVQIGTESSGISSDFSPTPPSLTQKHPTFSQNFRQTLYHESPSNNTSSTTLQILIDNEKFGAENGPFNNIQQFSRFMTKSSSLSAAFHRYRNGLFSAQNFNLLCAKSQKFMAHFHKHLCRLRLHLHLRLILLFALPVLYFLVSQPSHSLILDFLSAFAFSATLLFSINLAIPRLPTIKLLLDRSLPVIIKGNKNQVKGVFWSIGSRPNADKKAAISGCFAVAYTNGDVYEGEFHEGQYSGSGVYVYFFCGRYEGDWVDGKYDGYGVETWAKGSRYKGQYRQGFRHGYRVFRFYTGDVYAGEWFNGQGHGGGIHTAQDGNRYVGQFKYGIKHGLGHNHYRNGDTYAGEYFGDKMHGFGIYRFANGHTYEGAWHEGRRQGLGTYTFSNGQTQSGHWQDSILHLPTTQNTNLQSKVLNAVREARWAAGRAYKVMKVDERVNRAVSAADRAATAARAAATKARQN